MAGYSQITPFSRAKYGEARVVPVYRFRYRRLLKWELCTDVAIQFGRMPHGN